MNIHEKPITWVVYLMTIHKRTNRHLAVCEQDEWDAIELSRPGYHHLVRGGIATEVEAEALARHHLPVVASDAIVPASRALVRKQGVRK